MERLVVSLETAKKLKAAGFPQDTHFVWGNLGELWDRETYLALKHREWCAAPTAQEIADELPPVEVHKFEEDNFTAREYEGYRIEYFRANTMAEALAALYLKLKEAPK